MDKNNTTNEHIIPTMGRTNCGGRCRLLITEKDGKIIDMKGDPAYPDKMPCIRGLNYHKTFLGADRLTTPLIRIGKRGEGKFEPISWKEAVDLITKEWIRIRDTYGPASRYVNYGWGVEALMNGTNLAKRLLRPDGGHLDYYNNYSTACTSYTTPYLYGTTQSGSSFDTLIDSKLIILWAHNPAETRFDNLMYWLRKAKRQGTEIIVIDPRRNATVDALGAEWIGIKPTTDSALMDAMAYVIWKEDLYDHDFIKEKCIGFDRYFAYLDGKEPGREDEIIKNPFWASRITGISEETIENLARRYALAKPAALMQGYGGQRHMNGEQFTRGGIMLACLTGNVGISGGWASGAGQCSMVDLPSMPMPENPVKASIPVFMWTDAVLNGQNQKIFGTAEGLIGAERLDCGIKMLINLAGNILINQHSDINRTKKILEDESFCEFIVCSDLFMTPSAKHSDLVLPATSMLESDNIVTPWNQGDFLGFCNKIVEPVGESRFEFEWLYEVAQNLGLAEEFACGHSDYNTWMKAIYEDYREKQMPSYEELKEAGIYVFPNTPKVIAFEKQRTGEKTFPTPSGKVEIYSKELEDLNHPAIPAVPGYVEAEEGPGTSQKYPLQLIGWHTLGRAHSVHFNNEELKKKYPQQLWMNPEDGQARGLKNGDMAEVFNDRGCLLVPVLLTDEIIPGVTAIAQGAWHRTDEDGRDVEASINILTTQKPTPLAKGNPQHTNLVEVRKFNFHSQ
ncbi:MAG: dimethyl sulfoxide reductase subunit A [Lachnospiraceae bacterium]|nr:dimethyl sulfoxide reductase subunit A [Lachnospiraceae bacterium]